VIRNQKPAPGPERGSETRTLKSEVTKILASVLLLSHRPFFSIIQRRRTANNKSPPPGGYNNSRFLLSPQKKILSPSLRPFACSPPREAGRNFKIAPARAFSGLKILSLFLLLAFFSLPSPARASCFNPAGNAGDIIYNGGYGVYQYGVYQYCNGGAWIGIGPYRYIPNAVVFDGSTTYLSLTGTLTGSFPTGNALGSFWFQRRGGLGTAQDIFTIYSAANPRFVVSLTAGNLLNIKGYNSAATKLLDISGSTAITDSNWHHVAFSFSFAAPWKYIYLDDVAETLTVTTFTNGSIEFNPATTPKEGVGATPTGTALFNGALADFFWDEGSPLDLSVTANRRLFIDANKQPVNLGTDGSKGPSGVAAFVFLSAATASWQTNKGSGGGFTLHGTLGTALAGDINTGLEGYWKFDEASGTLANDSSSGGNNGTLTNGPTWGAGKVNNALTFNGTTQYVSTGNATLGSSAFTVTAWVKPATVSTTAMVLYYSNTGNTNRLMMRLNNTGHLEFYDEASGSIASTATLSANAWRFVAMTFDGSTKRLYVDSIADSTGSSAYNSSANSGPYYIGKDPINGNFFNGTIDEVRIYNRALSASDVLTLYNSTATACASPTGYAGDEIYNNGANHVMQYCNGSSWVRMGPVPGAGGAGCSNPAGNEGDQIYSKDYYALQYCDGTNWVVMGNRALTGLVGWWNLDEGSGTTAADSSGNNLTGNFINTPTWVAGKINNGLSFNGYAGGQGVSLGNPAALQITGSMTVTGWVKFNGFGADDDQILSKFTPSGQASYELKATRDCGGPQNAALMISGDGTNYFEHCSNTVLTTGQWYFIAGVYNAPAQTLLTYVNGVDDSGGWSGAYGSAVPASIFNSTTNAYIGTRPASGETINGIVDDVRIYNRALGAGEIQHLYNGGP
jgi:hypothetical protein